MVGRLIKQIGVVGISIYRAPFPANPRSIVPLGLKIGNQDGLFGKQHGVVGTNSVAA